jgi:hypothetical protein
MPEEGRDSVKAYAFLSLYKYGCHPVKNVAFRTGFSVAGSRFGLTLA